MDQRLKPFERILQSVERVVQNSQHVSLGSIEDIDAVAQKLVGAIESKAYSFATWKSHPLHPHIADHHAVHWIFFMDLMNFSFWSDNNEPFTVEYQGKLFTGYWSLCAAIKKAVEKGIPLYEPAYMATMPAQVFDEVFKSETGTEISFKKERLQHIHQAGQVLCQLFDGSFANIVQQAQHSCQRLIEIVLEHFPTFNDVSMLNGTPVYLYKRVQILVADLWACFEGQGLGQFDDIDAITMFADYRVPQSLCYLNLLNYSPELLNHLQKPFPDCVLQHGHPSEMEIRANSIWIVEQLAAKTREKLHAANKQCHVNAILIDFYLWAST